MKRKSNWALSSITFIAIVILIYSNNIFAIGLGELKVNSYLNQPLSADLILNGTEDLESNAILVELASVKDFMRAGIPRPLVLSSLKFEVQKDKEIFKVHISSNKIIKDPFLDFLVKLTWPEGSIVKSYTILLDPTPLDAKENNDSSSNLIPPDYFNNINVSTQVAESSNNEAISKPELKTFKNNSQKNITASEVNKSRSNNHNALLATVTTEDLEEANDKLPGASATNSKINPNKVLASIIGTLQNFSANNSKNKMNYEKLFDLQPNIVSLSTEEKKLAENAAIAQINSELNLLRNSQDAFKEQSVTTVNSNINPNNNSNDLTYTNSNPTVQSSNQKNPNGNYNLYYSDLNTNKFGINDLLVAFFLVSTTMFIFYKIIPANNPQEELIVTEENLGAGREILSNNASNLNINPFTQANIMERNNNDKMHSVISEQNYPVEQNIELDLKLVEDRINKTTFVRNEEIELKMALANQYIAAGDRKSAKELLEEIINVKEQEYSSKISNMLKSIS